MSDDQRDDSDWTELPLPEEPSLAGLVQLQPLYEWDESLGLWSPLRLPETTNNTTSTTSASSTRPIHVISWNIDALAAHSGARTSTLLDTMFEAMAVTEPSTLVVVLLQEVHAGDARGTILSDERVRAGFLTSHAFTQQWRGRPFTNITLVSNSSHMPVCFSVPLRSHSGRAVLFLDLPQHAATTNAGLPRPFRIANVHFDHNKKGVCLPEEQLETAAKFVRPCGQGLIAGDFNLSTPDLVLVDGFEDIWSRLRPGEDGFTWVSERRHTAARLDRCLLFRAGAAAIRLLPAPVVNKVKEKSIPVQGSGSGLRASDHSGLHVICSSNAA